MTNEDLAKCAQLDMIKELDRICTSNSIPYFLVGGSLIGAIRHEGFIPWDDDIDVGMLRSDYCRFVEVCKKELLNEYSLYDWHSDPNSPIPFLKMKIKGTHYKEELSKHTNINDEIYIDIFPYDNAPNNYIIQKIHALKNFVYKKVILLKCGFAIDEGSLLKKTLYLPFRLLSHLYSINEWKRKYEINAQKYNTFNTPYVVCLGGAYSYKKELKTKSCLTNQIKRSFEGVDLSVPAEYDRFLREIYGDYMKLPPKEERVSRHGILLFDIGEYRVKSTLRRKNGQ